MDRFEILTQGCRMTCIALGMEIPFDYERPSEWKKTDRVVIALLADNENSDIYTNLTIETPDPLTLLQFIACDAYGSGFKLGLDFLEQREAKGELDYAISPISFCDAIERLKKKVNGVKK